MKVTAQYSKNSYTVEFVINGQSTPKDYYYGEMPTYEGNPTKPETDGYVYWFSGWSPTIEPVVGPAVYTAVFDSLQKKYRIRFVYDYGTVAEGDWGYGVTPTCDDIPTKPATETRIKVNLK